MNILRNIKLKTPSQYSFLLDVYYIKDNSPKPVVIFSHGFKGFKDWGTWDLIAKEFAKAGYIFIKYNFSHNGTTIENPLEFDDLDAFGRNTFTQELEDLETVIDWVLEDKEVISINEKNPNLIALIGHSRGGGTSIIKACHNHNIKALITWASVNKLDYSMQDKSTIDKWKKDEVIYVYNGRTKQNMPLYLSLYIDFIMNNKKYNIRKHLPDLNIPMCIIHGSEDKAVPFEATIRIQIYKTNSIIKEIKGADHVFGGSHPYEKDTLPEHSKELVSHSLDFLDRYFKK